MKRQTQKTWTGQEWKSCSTAPLACVAEVWEAVEDLYYSHIKGAIQTVVLQENQTLLSNWTCTRRNAILCCWSKDGFLFTWYIPKCAPHWVGPLIWLLYRSSTTSHASETHAWIVLRVYFLIFPLIYIFFLLLNILFLYACFHC